MQDSTLAHNRAMPGSSAERRLVHPGPWCAVVLLGVTGLVTTLILALPLGTSLLNGSGRETQGLVTASPVAATSVVSALLVSAIATVLAARQDRPAVCWALAVAAVAALAPLWASSGRLPDRATVACAALPVCVAPAAARVCAVWTGRPAHTVLSRSSWIAAFASILLALTAYSPYRDPGCLSPCPDVSTVPPALVSDGRVTVTMLALIATSAGAALLDVLMHRGRGPRVLRTCTAVAIAPVFAVALMATVHPDDGPLRLALMWASLAAMVIASAGAVAAALGAEAAQRAMSRLVDRLDDPSTVLRDAAAGAEVYYAMPDGERWVDALGRDVDERVAGTLLVALNGDQPAVRVRTRSISATAEALARLTPADLMALSNGRAAAVTSAHRREVEESRRRIEATAQSERRRIERDLHDGAQQRLVSVKLHLRLAQSELPESAEQLRRAEDRVQEALVALRALVGGHSYRPGDPPQ